MDNNTLQQTKQLLRQRLLAWFEENGRDFPWRSTADPYSILIAEMMLRRTTAAAVSRVYSDFIERYRTPQKLARARLTTIEFMISSLGLQRTRAKHLQNVAVHLLEKHNGIVPTTMDELMELPGVGIYVASAVLNFAFGKSNPLVDGNVLHLLSRVFGLTFDLNDKNAWEFMGSFGPDLDNKVFYWSIIDLVALVCLRRTPRCTICPLSDFCEWHANYQS
ncbi:A/G-specific adenine glycosylase [Candidatus Thorarchaeota archaeon]|nr:MAG: A/G-specific adenine glycosylase [Candidatus Thorarchaeota archaeon]